MDKKKLYNEHLDEMFGSTELDKLDEKDVDRIAARLLGCLPNNGKLYKYRSIEGEAFEYAYDGLEKGYLYMAKANTLNDDLDSTLNYDVEKDVNRQMNLFKEKPWLYLDRLVRVNSNHQFFQTYIDRVAFQNVRDCVDFATNELNKGKAIELFEKIGVPREDAEKHIVSLIECVNNEIEEHAEDLKKPISSLVNFNIESRKNYYIFSMSEDYASDTMWAYYANNRGFCIEYDYNKINHLPFDKKRLVISTYRVIYKDQFEEYSFVDMIEYILSGKENNELMKKANREALERTITKLSEWEKEKEWRIFLCNLEDNNKIFADIVSGIILDERIVYCDKGQKLISLAKERGWNIKVRKLNRFGTGHEYVELTGQHLQKQGTVYTE